MKACKLPNLLNASLISGLLVGVPAFAATDAERIQSLEAKLDAVRNELSQMTSGMAHHSSSSTGLPLHGFVDMGFASNNDNNLATNPKGFFVGALSFYLTPNFGDNVKALIEPNFEVTPDGSLATDLERAQIGYTMSDAATLWGGRIHTPYGYWNTGFHHGGQMQTSVLRPRFLDFEDKGGILPAHIIGLWATGKIKAGTEKMTYDVYAGNGPKIVDATVTPPQAGVLDPNVAGDDNHSATVGFNVAYEFSGKLDGLRLAAHGLQGRMHAHDATPALLNHTDLTMLGGSAVYLENDWEALGEYYHFNNSDKSGNTGSHTSWAAFMQIGKNLNGWIPYVRFEHAVLNQQDNYFAMQANGQSYARQSLGIRYDLNPNAALKVELLNSDFAAEANRTASSYRSVYAQYAIGF